MTALVLVELMFLGGLGAVARFLVDGWVSGRSSAGLPTGTLTVNVTGALLLGLIEGLTLPSDLALLGGTGLVGAYTTFSTWMFETQRLVEERQLRLAALNVLVSIGAGVGAAALGLWIAA